MVNKEIVSVRLQPELIERLDGYAVKVPYLTRSMIIRNIVSCVFECLDDDELYKLVNNLIAPAKGRRIVIRYEKSDAPQC